MEEKRYLYNKLINFRNKNKEFNIELFCKFNNIKLIVSDNQKLFYNKEIANFLIDKENNIIVVRIGLNEKIKKELVIGCVYNILLYKKFNLSFNYIKYKNNIINKIYSVDDIKNIYNKNIIVETLIPSYDIPLNFNQKVNVNQIKILSDTFETSFKIACDRLEILNYFSTNKSLLNKIERYNKFNETNY